MEIKLTFTGTIARPGRSFYNGPRTLASWVKID